MDKKNNTGEENSGDWNSGDRNSGHWNSGHWNSGHWNSGHWNSGDQNSGNWNSGNRNSGDQNSGHWNSGHWNSGDQNSGHWNSGHWNSGDQNSGYGNSGNQNSGDRNSGNQNSGYGNSANRESGIFNSTPGTLRMFNKLTDKTWDNIDHPDFDEFWLTKWIPQEDMTDEEKKADPLFYVRQGYLKTFTWKEAWANFWRDTDEANRKKFLALPNFDPVVFEEITGIKVNDNPNLSGKEVGVTIDNKTYTAVIK